MSSLMKFLAGQQRTKGGQVGHNASPVPPDTALGDLTNELAALDTLTLRSMLLEERKVTPNYKALFPAAETPASESKSRGASGQPLMDVDAPAASAKGATALAEPLTFKIVPEYKEITSGVTSVKVVVSVKAASEVSKLANVALVAVVDKSGSMEGNKIELVRGTVEFLADQLGPQDALGLVTYSDEAKRNLPLLLMTPTGKTLAQAVNRGIRTDGCTALHDGLLMGINEHSSDMKAAKADREAIRRVRSIFLCTDGLPNVGPSDSLSIVSAMRAQLAVLTGSEEPCSIHTFGFGSDHDPKLLQAIAEAGNGIYYYIQDERQIPEAFGDALGGLLSVVASNVTITVTTLDKANRISKVESGGLQQPAAATDSTEVTAKFADLFAEETREVLLELHLPAADGLNQEGQLQQLVKVDVAFADPNTGAVSSSSQVLTIKRTAAPTPDQARDPLVATTAARFHVAEALKAAAAESEASKFDEAEKLLDEAWTKVDKEEGMGEAKHAYMAQLAGMKTNIKTAKSTRNQREREMLYGCMNAASTAMQVQRAAGVGMTSYIPQCAAMPAPPAADMFGAAASAAPGSGEMQQQQQQAAPWAVSNKMRSKMTADAADFVSKRGQKQ